MKYIRAYVETAHASAVKALPGLLAVPPGSSSPVNQNKQVLEIKETRDEVGEETGLLARILSTHQNNELLFLISLAKSI